VDRRLKHRLKSVPPAISDMVAQASACEGFFRSLSVSMGLVFVQLDERHYFANLMQVGFTTPGTTPAAVSFPVDASMLKIAMLSEN